MAGDLGEDMLAMVASFNCLKDDKLTATEIGQALFSGTGDASRTVRNAMAWFCLEEVARELCPDV